MALYDLLLQRVLKFYNLLHVIFHHPQQIGRIDISVNKRRLARDTAGRMLH